VEDKIRGLEGRKPRRAEEETAQRIFTEERASGTKKILGTRGHPGEKGRIRKPRECSGRKKEGGNV